MPVSFRLLPTLTFLLLLPGVPVWALTASDTTRPAQAQDPLPDMGIAPQVVTKKSSNNVLMDGFSTA